MSSLVGRKREASEVKRLLSAARLVTLIGPGGVGKTRLAIRVATGSRQGFQDGAWLVELAALEDPALLVQTVANALGIRDHSARSPMAALTDHLVDKQMLLVLDNCEHLLDACARLAGELLTASAGLRILATSRHVLAVPGEHVLPVLPLAVPSPDQPLSSADAEQYDAVRLFVERATAVLPDFKVTDDNYPVLAGICHLLDGIPLAIELAAGRLPVLAEKEILDRLGDRFHLLTGGRRVAETRHQTLQATIDWSFDLCAPEEQALWTRLSVFSGGCDLDAAEAVCAGRGIARENVLDLMAELVDKSLLIKEEHDGRTYYRMLHSIRDYGRTRLPVQDGTVMRRRHRDYYHRMAALADADWLGPRQSSWCERLRAEHANLRAALDFCLAEPGEKHVGLVMVTLLGSYWVTCGFLSEGHRWVELFLALADEPTPLRAKALWIAGWIRQVRGDHFAARVALDECHALAEQLGYRSAQAYAVHYSAHTAMSEGDHARALVLYEDALARHRALNDEVGVITLLYKLAFCYCLRGDTVHGDIDHAIALCAECLRRSEACGEIWCRSYALYVYGLGLWKQGDHHGAAEMGRSCIRLKEALTDTPGVGLALELLAWIAAAEGHHERAACQLGAAQRIWQTIGGSLNGIEQLRAHHDETETAVREALGATAFHAALRKGMEFTFAQAVGYALGEDAEAEPSAPHLARRTAQALLSRRELQVAQLVARGMSNKDIAEELVISRRTVEAHVQRILTKLDCTSRARIAAWIAEQRT
ncbi:ATP-binding protein [Allokutzneria albata]|uniref:ATP-binding protein n=1 Tax=Allokutzneria albata TaxID=211114 RepID=UPI0006950D10|nr:LuxR C-terminal-related transcriptional regulator [Allokutzneria albata]